MATKISGTNTAAAPGVTGDDTDTGLFYGTNEIGFSTGGTSRLTLDSSGFLNVPDGGKIRFGTGNDLEIFHNGNDSILHDNGTGSLKILASNLTLQNAAGTQNGLIYAEGGSVELYHNNNKKLETVSGGATITGVCTATSFAGSGASLTGISSPLSFRNCVVNGQMRIAQRGSGTSNTALNGWGTWTDGTIAGPDQFNLDSNLASLTGTQSQSTESPDGFGYSYKIDMTGGTGAMGATEYISVRTKLEAQNLQHLKNGTASAVSTTLSFWVRGPVTGTYTVRIRKEDNTAREITKTYTISTANTWEQKSLTFAGDTSGGGINNDNGTGLQISWCIGAGSNYTSTDSTSWINGATAGQFYGHTATATSQTGAFYLTGVQFETGSTATEFEHKSATQDMLECQRYLHTVKCVSGHGKHFASGTSWTSGCCTKVFWFPYSFPTRMRAAPTMVKDGAIDAVIGGTSTVQVVSFAAGVTEPDRVNIECNHADTTGSNGLAAVLGGDADGSTRYVHFYATL
jgi:hypothetical protein